MRCLNYCEYYPMNQFTFLCKNFPYNISDKILKNGHQLVLVDYDIEPCINNLKTWIGTSTVNEINIIKDVNKNNYYDMIIIDHYGIDYEIEQQLSNFYKKIIIINDLFEFKHYCDEFINYNSNDLIKMNEINLKPNTKILCGTDNIIINKKFSQFKKQNLIYPIKKICIMLGGSDPNNFTLQIIKELDDYFKNLNLFINIVIGKSNSNYESILKFIKDKNYYRTLFDLNYDELIQLYLDIDLCIGSLSITSYERLYMNVKQICIKIVENQNYVENNEHFNITNIDNIKEVFLKISNLSFDK